MGEENKEQREKDLTRERKKTSLQELEKRTQIKMKQ